MTTGALNPQTDLPGAPNPQTGLPGASATGRHGASQKRKAQTRKRLLAAARTVFAAHGYEAASVAQIADQAGLSKGALYVHFDTKEALFRDILLDYVRQRSAATAARLHAAMPLHDAIVQIIRSAWAMHGDGTSCALLSTEFFALAGRSDWGQAAMARVFEHCSAALAAFLDQARARGQVRADVDSRTAARLMLALHDGLILQWQSQPEAINPEDYVRPMADMIFAYVSAPKEGS